MLLSVPFPAFAQESSGPSANTAHTPSSSGDYADGFRLASGPDGFTLTLNGFVQTRYTWFAPDTGDATQNFDVALARLALGGGAFDEKVSYFFQLEASTFGDSNSLSLLDGWVQYRIAPSTAVKAGRILLPYSRQFLTHPGNLLFGDLSAADYAFNLPRAIGVSVSGAHGRFGYDAAVANSVRALDAGGQQNRSDRVATMARGEFAILGPYGYLESAARAASPRQLSVGLAAAYNPVVEGSTFQNVLPGDRTSGLTVDAGYREGPFSVQGAFYLRSTDASGDEWLDRGGYLQAGVFVVPDVWEVAARTSIVDFDRARATAGAGDIREYELGVNRYVHRHNVKVQGDAGLIRRDAFDGARQDDRRVRIQLQLLF